MMQKLLNMIKRSVVTNPSTDTMQFPIAQISYNGKIANTEILWPYGIGGILPKDSIGLTFAVMGQEENKVTIGSFPQIRPRGLVEGEFYVSNLLTGSIILFKKDGKIEIQSKNNLEISVDGDVNITANTANINAKTNLGGGGPAIARVGDVVNSNSFPFPPIGIIATGSPNHTAS